MKIKFKTLTKIYEVDKYASEIMENDEMPLKEREWLTKEILEEFRKNKKVLASFSFYLPNML